MTDDQAFSPFVGHPTGGVEAPPRPQDRPPTSDAPTRRAPAPRPQWRARSWVAASAVGALVGAGVSAGALLALDEDPGPDARAASDVPVVSASAGQVASVQEVLAAVEPATVVVSTQGFARGPFGRAVETGGAGTGMVLAEDGLIVTNAHVVAGASTIEVRFGDGSVHEATLVGTDRSSDVAVLQTEGVSGAPTVELAPSAELEVGETVIAIGNALDLEGGPTVTQGIISALDRSIETTDAALTGLVQTDAAINPGNSGGPLVDAEGRVVGMNTAVAGSAENIGFAVPADGMQDSIEAIQAGDGDEGAVAGGTYLGVQVTDAPGGGATLAAVEPGSPAAEADLAAGDVVIAVDGEVVTEGAGLVEAVQAAEAGDVLSLTIRRGGAERTVDAELGAR